MRNALFGLALAAGAAAPVAAQTPLTTQLHSSGYNGSLLLTSPKGDFNRQFVVEQRGQVWVVENGIKLPVPFLNIQSIVRAPAAVGGTGGGGNEEGLLGLAFHPDYFNTDPAKSGGFFYVYYTNLSGNNVVARYTVPAPFTANTVNTATAQILVTFNHPTQSNHNGGNIAFGPDGFLYIGTGDGGSANDPPNNAQNINSFLGKMLRINVDKGAGPPYAIPANNPYVGVGGLDEIWAQGLRNPWRWSFDRLTGAMYIGDVGQGQREEVDYVAGTYAPTAGGPVLNFNWRCREGFIATPGIAGCANPPYPGTDMRDPIWDYTHGTGLSIAGGHVYRGCEIPDLRGTYFFADTFSNIIWSFKYSGAGVVNAAQVTNRTTELDPAGADTIATVTSFGEDARGEMYIVERGGQVWKIVPTAPVLLGYSNYGVGTPGCAGAQSLQSDCTPCVGGAFELSTINAPASSLGLLIITNAKLDPAIDVFGIGVPMNINLFTATEIYTADLPSDAGGIARAMLQIPNISAFAGLKYYVQGIFGSACGSGVSGTDGGEITIQP